ncbi:MAG: oligosaccharide flippase family protein [Candidatus Andersenbacteria bacterium]
MKQVFTDWVWRVGDKVNRRLYKHDLTADMRGFVSNLGYVGLSSIVSGLLFAVVQILAVRALGPAEYGRAALVFAVANVLPYPMFFGLQASVIKYLPEKRSTTERRRTITTFAGGTLFFSALTLVVAYFVRNQVTEILSLSSAVYTIALFYCIVTVFKTGMECVLRGLLKFKLQAALDIVYATVGAMIFLALYAAGAGTTYTDYIGALAGGLLAYAAAVLLTHWHYFKPSSWDTVALKQMLSYGAFSVLGSVALFILWGSDRFFLNRYLDVESVGIYSVYYGASLIVLGRVSSVFIKVFLPTASSRSDKLEINRRLNRLMFTGFIPLLLLNGLAMYITVLLYGDEYPMKFLWILLFSVNAILYTFVNVRGALVVAQGVRGHTFYSYWAVCMAALAFLLYLIMIPLLEVTGAIMAVMLVSFVFFVGLSGYAKRLLQPE